MSDVSERVPIVFVAGTGRSGSTLLGNALGEMSGCFHGGELSFVLGQFDADNRICGCGRSISQCAEDVGVPRRWCPRICGCGTELGMCDLWREVKARAFDASWSPAELAGLGRFSVKGMRYTPKTWFQMRRRSGHHAALARRYASALGRIYMATAEATKAEFVIDSSKLAMHVYLAVRFAGVKAHVVHLVRDPRAIAYSWQRRDIDEVISGPVRVSANWVASNMAIRSIRRHLAVEDYTFVRYEDFIREPRATLETLGRRIGVSNPSLPFIDETTLRMNTNHTVAGSPSRFKRGDVKLAPDEEWRQRMRSRDRLLATVPAAPVLGRFGYALAS